MAIEPKATEVQAERARRDFLRFTDQRGDPNRRGKHINQTQNASETRLIVSNLARFLIFVVFCDFVQECARLRKIRNRVLYRKKYIYVKSYTLSFLTYSFLVFTMIYTMYPGTYTRVRARWN
jgi:hypothetical protein